MARRKRNVHLLVGIIAGVLLGYLVKICLKGAFTGRSAEPKGSYKCATGGRMLGSYMRVDELPPEPLQIIGLTDDKETVHNSKRSLLFVGVMTADKYLKTRAAAVYRTWGKDLPGRIAFFCSERSKNANLPLVSLKGVDDSYPPQKKSFMMLLYMHDNFIDRFEWFLRADDDVYIKTDKLEGLLRSVDSRRAQFIGQAGRGTSEEFGSLSLEYDENFCMGGPGVIMSRETLKRIAPHIKECLKNLYTTHEDVELGRCVQKYAGIPCTWSYEMQSILYHNSSGNLAFTSNLKKKEVHHAITMHPVKDHKHMYRIDAYLKNLKIQDLRELSISLHRDILTATKELNVPTNNLETHNIANSVPLFPFSKGFDGYLGDTKILGVSPTLNRYHPKDVDQVISWNFISKLLFSVDNLNPKRRMEFTAVESLDDIIRELMEIINAYSKQRGRIIEFREILYGYNRLDPIHGADYILDILLVYKKYRGRKMTVPVRRHAYLQQSFTGIEIREVPIGEAPISKVPKDEAMLKLEYNDNAYPNEETDDNNNRYLPFLNFKKLNVPIKGVFESGLMKLSENLPSVFGKYQESNDATKKIIHFILPLSGRFDIFMRFLRNYEEICIKDDGRTSLVITLYKDSKQPEDFEKTITAINDILVKYPNSEIIIIHMNDPAFSRGRSLEKGIEKCSDDSLLFLVDVDILFNLESLRRIRFNTILQRKAYFPIVFSEYNPNVINGEQYNKIKLLTKNAYINDVIVGKDLVISDSVYMRMSDDEYHPHDSGYSDNHGYFRQYGFGIASFYKSDYLTVGGFNMDIKGWGLEDVNLFDQFIKSNITIFRAIDPGLIHVFHQIICDKNLDVAQYNMCTGTRANTLGSMKHMVIYLINNPDILTDVKELSNVNNAKPKVVP